MSKLDKAPFKIWDRVKWFSTHGARHKIKREGIIVDAFYQYAKNNRKEGWRLLIRKDFIDGDNHYLEKQFSDINLV